MATTTLKAIRQEVAARLGSYASGTATGGTTSTVVINNDAEFIGDTNTPSPDLYEASWVLPTSGNNAGVVRRVKDDGFAPNTGTLTVVPVWSNAMANTNTFEVHGTLHPDRIKEAINRALRKMHFLHTFALTLVTDGDMETSGVGSWTASNASLAKTTSAAQVITGAQGMSVTTTSANGYAGSTAIPVEEGQNYYAQVSFKNVAAAPTPTLVAYAATGSAEIDSTTWTEGGDGTLRLAFRVPDDCRSLVLRLQVVENSKVVYYDEAILLQQGRRSYPLPTFVLNPESEIHEVYPLAYQSVRTSSDQSRPMHREYEVWSNWDHLADPLGPSGQQYSIILAGGGTTARPVWVQMWRRFDELSADSDATSAALDWAAAGGLMECYKILRSSAPATDVTIWDDRLSEARSNFIAMNQRYVPRKAIRVRAGHLEKM